MVDYNQAIINYLIVCPQIRDNPLFFNAINAKDNNKQIVTTSESTSTQKKYVDGSVAKTYTFTIIDYRSVSYQPVVKSAGYTHENVSEMLDVQGIIDWITNQNDLKNFPNFGINNIVESIRAVSNMPNLNGIDNNVSPALAKYSISIRVDYIDNEKRLWS